MSETYTPSTHNPDSPQWQITDDALSVHLARQGAQAYMDSHGVDGEVGERVALVFSELAANEQEHGEGAPRRALLDVVGSQCVRILVSGPTASKVERLARFYDAAAEIYADDTDEDGRGRLITLAVASQVKVYADLANDLSVVEAVVRGGEQADDPFAHELIA